MHSVLIGLKKKRRMMSKKENNKETISISIDKEWIEKVYLNFTKNDKE